MRWRVATWIAVAVLVALALVAGIGTGSPREARDGPQPRPVPVSAHGEFDLRFRPHSARGPSPEQRQGAFGSARELAPVAIADR